MIKNQGTLSHPLKVGENKEMKRLFGTDVVCGVANLEPMTSETAMKLGRAATYLFKNETGPHRVVIGKDTRISGYMLECGLTLRDLAPWEGMFSWWVLFRHRRLLF